MYVCWMKSRNNRALYWLTCWKLYKNRALFFLAFSTLGWHSVHNILQGNWVFCRWGVAVMGARTKDWCGNDEDDVEACFVRLPPAPLPTRNWGCRLIIWIFTQRRKIQFPKRVRNSINKLANFTCKNKIARGEKKKTYWLSHTAPSPRPT